MDLPPAPPDPLAERFVRELLGTGLAFVDTLSSLIESLEDSDPWPDEEPAEVLLAMTAGSIRPALSKMSAEEAERVIEMIKSVRERFVADLRLAAELSRRRESMGS